MRLTECSVFCEIHSCEVSAQDLVKNRSIKGLILSGGPASVYDEDAPHVSSEIWSLAEEQQWPVLGICYGFQEMVHHSGGNVEYASEREYGLAVRRHFAIPVCPSKSDYGTYWLHICAAHRANER